jgi:GntR family transcriptional regulator
MSKPAHLSIRDDLRIRITAGEWPVGRRLPSETDLAAWYGVARMTIRQAIGALASEGVLVRRQGLGTFATEPRPIRSDWMQSYSEEIYGQDHDFQRKLVRSAVEVPPAAARQALQLRECTVAIIVRRLRIVDDLPIAVKSSWLPYTRFAGLDGDPLRDGSLYATIEERYGARIARARQTMTAAGAAEEDAKLLGLQPGDPVLHVVRTAFDSSNVPIEYSEGNTRPGYPVETILERSATAEPGSWPGAGPRLKAANGHTNSISRL